MPLPETPLSQVCRSIADFLSGSLGASQNHIQVTIGIPSEAVPEGADSHHRVNLFFYRLEPGGFGPSADPDEPWRLRLHCLVTSFGVQEVQEGKEGMISISAGENDLRLLGGVLRTFHEMPLLVVDIFGVVNTKRIKIDEVHVQIVFQPLSTEEINHLWSTQGHFPYRPSVAYEMALVPVLPRQPDRGVPRVGALGFEARAGMAAQGKPYPTAVPPQVVRVLVDAGREDWAPRVCFVLDGGACAESLSFEVGSSALGAFVPRAWIAGKVSSEVSLVWEVWDRDNGWRREPTTKPAHALTEGIDPDSPPAAGLLAAWALPFVDHPGQAVLYAERGYKRSGDGAPLTVRSNPLLVSLYPVSP
jgi:hypothetical protein